MAYMELEFPTLWVKMLEVVFFVFP
jgi:hypothetical protein